MDLKVTVDKKEAGSFIVYILGSLDTATYTILDKEVSSLLVDSTKMIVIDMEALTYISSMGIGEIIKIKKALEQNQGKLILTNLQPQVRKVFDIVKAIGSSSIFKSIEEADAYWAQIQKKELEKGKSI